MRCTDLPARASQPLERQGEVTSPLVASQRVDLVDDHGAHGREHAAAARARQHQIERFRGRHQEMRRTLRDSGALCGRGVAGPDEHPDLRQRRIGRADLRERSLQVPGDVVGQGAERRHVEDPGLVGESRARPEKGIDRGEKRGEGLARPGRSGDQRVMPGTDGRPTVALGRRRLSELFPEPGLDGGVETGEGHGASILSGKTLAASARAGGAALRNSIDLLARPAEVFRGILGI